MFWVCRGALKNRLSFSFDSLHPLPRFNPNFNVISGSLAGIVNKSGFLVGSEIVSALCRN